MRQAERDPTTGPPARANRGAPIWLRTLSFSGESFNMIVNLVYGIDCFLHPIRPTAWHENLLKSLGPAGTHCRAAKGRCERHA